MSPSIPFCHHKCLFCWRDINITSTEWEGPYDDPGEIIDGCIKAQRSLLVGYFGNSKANKIKIQQAQHPNNAAISLAGEPMLYPPIEELIEEFKKRKFTTFLVTNGMTPEKLESLNTEPTQLYISLDAPNPKIYKELCAPQIENGWNKLNKSLSLLNSFKSRKVIRMTCVNSHNMINPQEYADIINRSEPDYVEVKAYMFVGSSRDRLQLDHMPSFDAVKDFAAEVARFCGREIINEAPESRVVLIE
jgi:tRNA wybutosine-synthesizing protein 1